MSAKAVRDEVKRILDEEWTACRVVDMANHFNVHATDMSPWVWPTFPPVSTERQVGLGVPGVRYWREEGEIQFIFGVQPNTGGDDVEDMATQMRKLFRGRVALGDNLVFRNVAPLHDFVAGDKAVSGNWFIGAVAASYTFTFNDEE